MTSDEHQAAKELFGKVLDLEPQRRAAILDEACAGRPHLRHEVESLLVAYQRAGMFIDAPLVAQGLSSDGVRTRAETMVGRTLGPYRIEAIIGEGGMGVVYRALDSKLNRPVAIKFISAADPAARRRFQREGGSPILICRCYPPPRFDNGPMPSQLSWTPDRRFVYLKFTASTYAIPLQPGQVLPPIPASGFQSKEAVAALPGARLISEESVFPGPNPSLYAFMKVATQRNIYRVPVP